MDYFKDVPGIDEKAPKDLFDVQTGASKKADKIAKAIFNLHGMLRVKKDDPQGEFYAAVARLIDKHL
jgi:hypothetical protein